MPYLVVALQNASCFPGNDLPTLRITSLDAGWKEAYQNWLKGKNPTSSVEWKKGVFAITTEINQPEPHTPLCPDSK